MASRKFPVGTRVKVVEGSGLDSGKIGTVMDVRDVRIRGDGVPLLEGAYSPVDWKKEVPIKMDDGTKISMFKNRLIKL